jgi:FlaA1/EpsC-like NDP-sugar epimerase
MMARGAEIFVPKLRAYSIMDLKNALVELIGDTGEEMISIRQGEKMHETLINEDEMRYTWELDNKYILFNALRNEVDIKSSHPEITPVKNIGRYSSDGVQKITIPELKQIILNSGLLDRKEELT